MIRKIVKGLSYLILALILIVALVLGFRWGWTQYAQRPIYGRLEFPGGTTGLNYNLQGFQVVWRDEQLQITHRNNPDKILWASMPGISFLSAAQGQASVSEARGSFFVTDQLQTICPDQTIQAITPDAAQTELRLTGVLHCRRSQPDLPYTITLAAASPNQLAFELALGDARYNRTFFSYASQSDEHFFGFGEQFSYFDFKGKRLPIFISEQGVGRGAQPITAGADLQAKSGGRWYNTYAAAPHYISSRLRSLFLQNTEYMVFDMRRADRVQVQVWSDQVKGRLLVGDSPAELIAAYTEYAGRQRPLPDWILGGAIVGMQGGTDKVRQVWADLQAHDTPIAAFWLQDWVGQRITSFGKQLWWNWELDEDRYSGWDNLVADLRQAGIRVLTYVNPFLADVSDKPNAKRNLFQEAQAQGYLVRTPEGAPYMIQNTSFAAGLLDLTNPAAVSWMQQVLADNVIGVGASGWMADFGEALPYDAQLFSGVNAAAFHNAYPVAWAQLNREVVEAADDSEDLVFFTRAGFTQSPTYATLFWLGDQLVSWDTHDGIKTAVTGLLSSGLSGYTFNHSDIGGYTTITSPIANYHRDKELLLRWMDLNAFTTIFRTHEGNIPDVNAQFYSDEASLQHFSRMAKVYAAWGFYRQALVQEAAATGLPVVRHLFLHYPDDPRVYALSYQEFMVGSAFLVAPALDPGVSAVEVYLPAGDWVHVWSGATYTGGQTVSVAAPLGEPAVFYAADSAEGPQFVANLRAAGVLP